MRKVVDLLSETRRDGYPAEYLLARLRARQTGFINRCPSGRAEEAWRELQKEYGWLFRQMEMGLRIELAPIFFYFELRNLFTALRFRAGEDRSGLIATLEASMLNAPIKSILNGEQTFPAMLKKLSAYLGRYDEGFEGLREAWQSGGIRNLETALLKGFTGLVSRERLTPAVRKFLNRLFERRNLLLLAKEKRWQLADSLIKDRRSNDNRRRLLHRLNRLEHRKAGIVDNPVSLDNFLLQQLAHESRKMAGSGRVAVTILSYLISCRQIVRDCGTKGFTDRINDSRTAMEANL